MRSVIKLVAGVSYSYLRSIHVMIGVGTMQTGTLHTTKAIAAIFPNEQQARKVMHELGEQGFKQVWLGTVRAGEGLQDMPIVEDADGGGAFESIGRFFGGEGDRSLHAVLTSQGIPSERARHLVTNVAPGNVVLSVATEDIEGRALETIEAHGGDTGREAEPYLENSPEIHERSSGFV
jgi:hypothetical protein